MGKRYIFLLGLLLFVSSFTGLKGQVSPVTTYSAMKYDRAYGLNESEVNGFVFDSRGIGWVGTSEGLYIYNGVRFFKAAEYYPGIASILNSSIQSIVYDTIQNNLFVITASTSRSYVYLLHLDKLTSSTTVNEVELVQKEDGYISNRIYFIQNSLYYKTGSDLVKLTYLGKNRVRRISGKAEFNWIFTSRGKICAINSVQHVLYTVPFAADSVTFLPIVALPAQPFEEFVSGKRESVFSKNDTVVHDMMYQARGLMKKVYNAPGIGFEPGSLRYIATDGSGNVFLGTSYGIIKLVPGNTYAVTSIPLIDESRSTWYNEERNLGVIATSKGLVAYSQDTTVKKPAPLSRGTSGFYFTSSIRLDYNHLLFFGDNTLGAAVLLNTDDFSHKRFSLKPLQNVYASYKPDNSKSFFLAAETTWRATLDGDTIRTVEEIFSDSAEVNSITGYGDQLLIATGKGLYNYSLTEKTVKTIRQGDFLCIAASEEGWVTGTRSEGIFFISPSGNIVDSLSAKNGLSNNTVFSLLYDSVAHLIWAGTKQGLTAYHTIYKVFRNYTTNDGLAHNEFNRLSAYQTPSGNIIMGGVQGISLIKPSITGLGSYQELKPVVLGLDILYPKDRRNLITLPYNPEEAVYELLPNVITMSLRTSGATSEKLIYLGYRLDNEKWKYVLVNEAIRFYNLSPGTHQLELKYAGADLKEGPVTRIRLRVQQVWYKKAWAIILFALVLGGILYRILKWRIDIVEAQSLRELNRNRELMLGVIAHDLRSPVSSYAGLAEIGHYLAEKKDYKKLSEIIRELDENGKHLLLLIDNLLSWGLAKRNLLKYVPEQVQLHRLIQGILPLYRNLAASKKMELKEIAVSEAEVETDGRALSLILRNLLDNAIKYSREASSIELELKAGSGRLEKIEVSSEYLPQLEEDVKELARTLNETGHRGAEMQGNKLGMTMVRDFVNLLGGQLRLNILRNRYIVTISFPD